MTGKDAIQRTRAFRRDLLVADSQARSELWRQWLGSRRIIEDEAYRLSQRIIEAGEATTGQWMQADRYRGMLEAIDAETVKYTRGAKGTSVKVQEWAGAQSVVDSKALLTAPALELGLTFSSPPREAVAAATGRLKTVHGSRLFADVSKQATSRVTDAIVSGIGAGKGPVAIARDVGRAGDIAGYRAQRIARTETMWAYREGQRYTYEQNPEVVLSFRWEATFDDRTCFCAGTPVETSRGTVPIEDVEVGDEVMTHTGRFRSVVATATSLSSDLYTISAGGSQVTCTGDHPFLARGGGELRWVAARDLRSGDAVVAHYPVDSRLSEVARNPASRDADDGVSVGLDVPRLPLVSRYASGGTMPEHPVDLDRYPEVREEEIAKLPSAGDGPLLNEPQPATFEAFAHETLWSRLARVLSVAPHRAELPVIVSGECAERLAAGAALDDHRGPSAPFGAVAAAVRAVTEGFPARFAGDIAAPRVLPLAVEGAETIPLGVRLADGEDLTASDARLRNPARGSVASARAEGAGPLRRILEVFPAGGAHAILDRLRSAVASGGMWVLGLMLRIASPRAELTPAPLDLGRVRGEHLAASVTGDFHEVSISSVASHNHSAGVYDIQVEEDESFIAGGFVVHNCPICCGMHGTVHPAGAPFSTHVACRCSQIPVTPSWSELGFSGIRDTAPAYSPTGVDRFARMPVSEQQRILGPSRYEAYKDGTGLRDMIGTTHHPIWGSGLRLKPVSQL